MNHYFEIIKKSILFYAKSRIVIIFITVVYTLIVLLVLLNRFWQFESYYGDQGYFEGAIWKVSKFQAPIVQGWGDVRVNILSDHFIPSLFIMLSPLYWFTKSYATTVIALGVYTGASVLVAYEIANKFIKNRFLIYALLFGYMFYIGMQNALIFFIHPVTLMLLPLMLLFWAIFNEKKILYYALLIFNLGFIEHISLLAMSLGIFLFFYKRQWRIHGIVTLIVGFTYGILVSRFLIPFLTKTSFRWYPDWPQHPIEFIARFFLPAIKVQTILVSLATFAFLPLFSFSFLPLIAQDFFTRFVIAPQTGNFRWDLGLHYNANLAVLLFIASVLSISKLQNFKTFKKYASLLSFTIFVTVIIFQRFIFHGPLGLVYNADFYKHTKTLQFMRDFVDKIPREGKIMTQNNLAVFLTHNDLYLLSNCARINDISPDVIAFDFRPGQSPNNMWPMDEQSLKELSLILKNSNSFETYYSEEHRYIFTKSAGKQMKINCPEDES